MIDTKINKILINVLTDGDINLPNTEKLLDIIIDEIYIKNQYDLVSVDTQELAKKLIDIIRNQPTIVRENFRILHLLFGLSILLKLAPVETIKDQYYYLLSKFLNLDEFSKQYRLVARSTTFKDFAIGTAKYFFDDEFYHKMELKEQERSIYMYFYASTSYSGSSKEHMENMYPELYKVFLKAIELKQSDLVFYLYTPLLYSHNTLATTQDELKLFNDEVETKLSEYIKTVMIPFHNLKPNNQVQKKDKNSKIKVAFIQERIFEYSINKVFKSLLKVLQENKDERYEFVILDINFAELNSAPKEVEKIKEFGFKYVDLHKKFVGEQIPFYSTVSKAIAIREYIIDEKFDIIIGGNGRPEFNFLYTTRTVPKQIYWSHGNYNYDYDDIDIRIKHGYIGDNEEIHNGYKFLQFPDFIESKELNPDTEAEMILKEKELYPKNKIVLGTIGRLVKLNNRDYLKLILDIMIKYPNTIYLACGSGDKKNIQKNIQEYNLEDRWFFPGQINQHIYGHIIDILPNTFPNNQGLSALEMVAKGKMNIQKITSQFSKTDSEESDIEIYLQNNDCKIDNIINDDKFKIMVQKYLKNNYFSNEDILNDKYILPTVLYVPTKSLKSYKLKLEYLINNYENIKEDIKSFSITMANSRWSNDEKTCERFYEILGEIENGN
ncbi:MAG: hypothetical protein U9O56_04535 [Campylobacterota bacterium]|nr:hypothetical protein [Campylobacterota bacterium]